MTPAQFNDASHVVDRWPGTMVPVVRFVNGQELGVLPVLFTHEVNDIGDCRRMQVV